MPGNFEGTRSWEQFIFEVVAPFPPINMIDSGVEPLNVLTQADRSCANDNWSKLKRQLLRVGVWLLRKPASSRGRIYGR